MLDNIDQLWEFITISQYPFWDKQHIKIHLEIDKENQAFLINNSSKYAAFPSSNRARLTLLPVFQYLDFSLIDDWIEKLFWWIEEKNPAENFSHQEKQNYRNESTCA